MSEAITDLAWYPPPFPARGRLPAHLAQVGQNYQQQESQERAYRNALCAAKGRLVEPPCCKTLHISLFFDGTGKINNSIRLIGQNTVDNNSLTWRAGTGQILSWCGSRYPK